MAIDWTYYGNDNVALGVDWNDSVGDTSVSLTISVYRWDRYYTDNYGSSFDESLSPDPSGEGYWSGIGWGSGSGTRTLDTFGERIYSRDHSPYTVTLEVITDSSFGTAYSGSFHTIGAETKTVIYTVPARWYRTVSFDANGGSGTPSSVKKWHSENCAIPSGVPTRPGYRFDGWATSKTGTASYQPGDNYGVNPASDGDTVTLYAVWTALTPAAPSSAFHTRSSDSKNVVSWTNNSTKANPYTKILVERSVDDGSFSQVASLDYSSSVTSYQDSFTSSNHSYAYRIRAYNGANYSSYSNTTSTTYNTPSAPTLLTAVMQSGTSVLLSWSTEARTATSQEIEGRVKSGGSWGAWSSVVSVSAGVTSYLRTGAPGGTVQYRIRSVRGNLASSWAESNETVTLQPPAAPTLVNPPAQYVEVGLNVVRLQWRHNSLDTSVQTKAEVDVKVNGGSWTTYTVTGNSDYYDLSVGSLSDGDVVTFRIRTWGAHAIAGPYSDSASFTMAQAPSVSILNPSSDSYVLESLPLEVSWSYSTLHSVVSRVFRLYDGDLVVFSSEGNSTSQILGASTFIPVNGKTYRIEVYALDSTGIGSSSYRTFLVDYDPPHKQLLDGVFSSSNLSVELTMREQQVSGYPDVEYMNLYRVMSEDFVGGRFNMLEPGLFGSDGVVSVDQEKVLVTCFKGTSKYFVGFDSVDYSLEGDSWWVHWFDGNTVNSVSPEEGKNYVVFDVSPDLVGVESWISLGVTNQAAFKNVRVYEIADWEDGNIPYEPPMWSVPFTKVFLGTLDVGDLQELTIVDVVPSLNLVNVYLLEAVSESGTVSEVYIGVMVSSGRRYAFNFGLGLGEFICVEGGVTYNEEPERSGNVYYPAGRNHGVAFDGDMFVEPISMSIALIDPLTGDDSEELYRRFRDLLKDNYEKVLRLPNGSVFFIKTPVIKFSYNGRDWYRTASLITEVVSGGASVVKEWLR